MKKDFSSRVRSAYETAFGALLGRYTRVAMLPIRKKWLAAVAVVAAMAMTVVLLRMVPTGFVPDEDMGSLMVDVSTPSGYTMAKTEEVMVRMTDRIQQLPEVESVGSVVGFGGANKGMVQVQLKPWSQRVSPSTVLNELGAFLGSSYVSNFNKYNQVYQVTMQLRPTDRADLHSLDRLFVRSAEGRMLPVSQFVTLRKEYMPQSLGRFNMVGSIDVTGSVAQGNSTGDAIRAIREVARKELPVGYGIEFGGITREESQTGSNVVGIFLVCIFFVYLIMVALYESLFIPLAVILGVPFGLMGALIFAQLFGVQNNIYLQVGLIMLIGLLCKTAILLTEYATQCRHAGMSLKQSAFFAAKMRLRPILMTSLTMIFGMLPLMFASGAGANGNRTVGVSTVGGMLLGTLGLLFVVPALFVIFQTLQERFKPVEFVESDDPLIVEEMKKIEEYRAAKGK
ncbi:MAG: efflux RND transporter permease subunit [Bacteroidales bacterium]|nr:efflux RND transporter permease subunit [Bacteroidales bacterium]